MLRERGYTRGIIAQLPGGACVPTGNVVRMVVRGVKMRWGGGVVQARSR
jgi:hypothetical protein